MAWYDLNDMPWLTKPGDPAGSLGKGIAAGSNLANTFLHGRQVRNQEDALRAEMEMRAKAAPLVQRAQEQNLQIGELKIEQAQREKQQEISNLAAIVKIADLQSVAAKTPDGLADSNFESQLYTVLKQTPSVGESPYFRQLDAGIKAAKSLRSRQEMQINALQNKLDISDATAEHRFEYLQTLKQLNEAVASGDMSTAAALDNRLNILNETKTGSALAGTAGIKNFNFRKSLQAPEDVALFDKIIGGKPDTNETLANQLERFAAQEKLRNLLVLELPPEEYNKQARKILDEFKAAIGNTEAPNGAPAPPPIKFEFRSGTLQPVQ